MGILDFLFPKRCVYCGRFGRYFCDDCRLKIEYIKFQICPVCEHPAVEGATHPVCRTKYTLDGLTCIFRYNGPVRAGIKYIKYRLVSDLAEEFISLIPSSFYNHETMKQWNNDSVLTPIPLHHSRLKSRGFNQAEVLGRLLAEKLGITINSDILKRIKKTTPQVEMRDRKKRLKNMENVFSINHLAMKPFNNRTIVLFDDVFTTGATLTSAANILKRAGIKKVWGLVLAHG